MSDLKFVEWNSENLKTLRHEKNLTQYALANEIGVHFQTAKSWELPKSVENKRVPSLTMMALLGKFYGVYFYAPWEIIKE